MNKELLDSLLRVQKEIPFVKRTTDAYKYKYAPLEEVWEKVKDTIQKHGFFVAHEIQNEGVLSTAYHEHGELHSYIPFSKDDLNPQDRGSEITYYKRYNLLALFNIQVEGEDDDAQSATKKPATTTAKKTTTTTTKPASSAQVGKIGALANKELGWSNLKLSQVTMKLYKKAQLPQLTISEASNLIEKLQNEVKKQEPKETIDVGDNDFQLEVEIPQ